MRLGNLMKKKAILSSVLIVFLVSFQIAFGQATHESFTLYYSYSGLGSNMGSMQPSISIEGTKLIYTKEQNSYYGKKTKKADTILTTHIRPESIQAILKIIVEISDSTIYEYNPCIMSGGIHYLTVIDDTDSTRFTMHNTFHRKALLIAKIINEYLPEERGIWATEDYILECEACWENMKVKKPKK